jgi:hypothetical protein
MVKLVNPFLNQEAEHLITQDCGWMGWKGKRKTPHSMKKSEKCINITRK